MLLYSKEQRISHFFTKLHSKIYAIIIDMQIVLIRRNELISLATRLKNNQKRRN